MSDITPKDIEGYMNMSLAELDEICIDPNVFDMLLTIGFNARIQKGWQQKDEQYHQMFARYNETTLSN